MTEDQSTNTTDNRNIFQLSIAELIDVYIVRNDQAELVWNLIMQRTRQLQQQNIALVQLLRDCEPHLNNDEELRERVAGALKTQEPDS